MSDRNKSTNQETQARLKSFLRVGDEIEFITTRGVLVGGGVCNLSDSAVSVSNREDWPNPTWTVPWGAVCPPITIRLYDSDSC